MGILNVDNIQPVGGGTTITLNSSEINVGTGITFESNGQANFSGIITASNFAKADGSSVGGASLTNGANNRVVTATGANALNGEANLTFDGGALTVNGTSSNDVITARAADTNGISVVNILAEGTTGHSRIKFSDTAGIDGQISYTHTDRALTFAAGGTTERLRIGTNGQIGIAGANYGTSGQVLTSQGASSAVQWATPSSFPTHIDIWRVTSDMGLSNGDYLTSNWNRAVQSSAEDQLTALKGAQVTQSSGVFTFPTTGIWQIMFQIEIYKNGACRWFEAGVIGTIDNFSSERVLATGYASLFSSGANTHTSVRTSTFYKVSNVSNNKIKFRVNMAAGVTNESSTTKNNTWVEFVRVSDI